MKKICIEPHHAFSTILGGGNAIMKTKENEMLTYYRTEIDNI